MDTILSNNKMTNKEPKLNRSLCDILLRFPGEFKHFFFKVEFQRETENMTKEKTRLYTWRLITQLYTCRNRPRLETIKAQQLLTKE